MVTNALQQQIRAYSTQVQVLERVNLPEHRKLADTLPPSILAHAGVQQLLNLFDANVQALNDIRSRLRETQQALSRERELKELAKYESNNDGDWLTVQQYAEAYGKSQSSIYYYIKNNRVLWKKHDKDRYRVYNQSPTKRGRS